MENNNNTPVTTPEVQLTPEEIKKKTQWGNLGLAVHNTELKLQAQAQAIISELKIATTVDEIIEAEAALKKVKSKRKDLSVERKNLTSRFDKMTTRLMIPENSIIEAENNAEKALIKMKGINDSNKAKATAKNDELRRIRETIANYISKMDATYKQKIADQVTKAFNYALGKGNIEEKDLPDYLPKCKTATGFGEFEFTYDICPIAPIYATKEEVLVIWNELAVGIRLGKDYVADYAAALDKQFAMYNVAVKNKEAAMKLAKENADKAASDLAAETEAKETAAKLEAISITHPTVNAGPEIKSLKKVFVLDMEDTQENAIKIMAAFIGNLALCEGGIRVTKWSNLSVSQMGNALVWAKNKDEKFECSGIKFKVEEKL